MSLCPREAESQEGWNCHRAGAHLGPLLFPIGGDPGPLPWGVCCRWPRAMGGSLVRGQALAGRPWTSCPGSYVPRQLSARCRPEFAGCLMAGVGLAPGDVGRLPGTFHFPVASFLRSAVPGPGLGRPFCFSGTKRGGARSVGACPGVDGCVATFLEAGPAPPAAACGTVCGGRV